jgi:hypothetical protein
VEGKQVVVKPPRRDVLVSVLPDRTRLNLVQASAGPVRRHRRKDLQRKAMTKCALILSFDLQLDLDSYIRILYCRDFTPRPTLTRSRKRKTPQPKSTPDDEEDEGEEEEEEGGDDEWVHFTQC